MKHAITILATGILLVVMVLLVAINARLSKKVTIFALIIAAGGGLLVYGYGYMAVTDNIPLATISALLAVCGSFVGADEYSVIPDAPALQTPVMQIVCTFIRICALYVTASTVITAIGAGALQRLRLWMSRRGKLNLIYGVNENGPDFGRQLLQEKHGAVVFVAEQSDDSASAIAEAGCVFRMDSHAMEGDVKFLRSIGFGRSKRPLTLYAIDSDASNNLHYARQLLVSLEALNIDPQQLRLVILGREEYAVQSLQAAPGKYGYGYVTVVNEPSLAARLLTQKYPPCNTIHFDHNGKATEDFEALLIGFGHIGQAVLKSLVMNAQFAGSHFRATVFSPDCRHADGSFASQCHQLYDCYDISFHEADGRSLQLYEYLNSRGSKLKYVAICTGSEKLNREIAEDLTAYFSNAALDVPVYRCSRSGVETAAADGTAEAHKLYSTDTLCSNTLDAMAMILNHRYHAPTEKTPLECWMECDYFSRQSCRASADFVPAMLRAVGKTQEQVVSGDWALSAAQLENLSKTEHLRWCAFHYCMGFSAMTDEEFSQRAQTYQQQAAHGQATLRIGKNMQGRTHACLVDWDALKELSQKEEAVTGKYVDYQALDAENVLAIPQLLQSAAMEEQAKV